MHLRSVQKAEAKLSTSIAKHCQVAHLLVLDRVPPAWPFEARTRQKANRTLIGAAYITSQPRYRRPRVKLLISKAYQQLYLSRTPFVAFQTPPSSLLQLA